MSIRSVFAAVAALLLATPVALRAQPGEADFASARKQFLAGQGRAAAQTLLMASLEVRQQVGRCKEMEVGSRLMDAESQLEKLAAAIRAGSVSGVKTLDQSLMKIDRVLAEHHLQLATSNLMRPRAEEIPLVAADFERAAFHFERSVTLNGHALGDKEAKALADVRALVDEIGKSRAIPAEAANRAAELQKLVKEPPL